ncbi:ParA family protein [Desulfocurvus sp.]|uniref:ParA family protein n=1 Tax=Desulfocurvus sp. TaxID=2871698 RepID=UPI0025C5E804|nr:ParA family protein [Desulfocurvus sp.]MCK9241070.1 AAA family ATPase [Desulfocurvus sp.]
MSRIIVVANQKGGVGKTTTAVNLAASLAVMEKNVLVVDCDPQANASSGFGVYPEQVKDNLYTVLGDPSQVRRAIYKTSIPYLSVLPAHQDLVAAELDLVNQPRREYFLRQLVEPLADEYEFIILDCPPSLGLITLNALCAAREVLIPLQCEYFALEGIAKLIQTYGLVRKRLNPDIRLLGVLLTMYDLRNRLSHQVKNEIRKTFPDYLLETIVPRNVRLSEAPSFGKPVISYDIHSKGAVAYLQLAQEVVNRQAH